MRILVLEDSETLATALCRFLRFLGHIVTCAATLRQAREAIAKGAFELLLADVQVPDGLGTELLAELPPAARMVTMSGHELYVPKGRDRRWIAHLPKPVSPEEIENVLILAGVDGRRRRAPATRRRAA